MSDCDHGGYDDCWVCEENALLDELSAARKVVSLAREAADALDQGPLHGWERELLDALAEYDRVTGARGGGG